MMRWRSATAMAAAALLAACGHSPATIFLVLDPVPPAASLAVAGSHYSGAPLRVPFLHLPVTLDRPEPTRQDAAGTLAVDDIARWSAPLGLMARDTLIQDLIARLPAGKVLPPDAAATAPERRVEVTVLSFAAGGGRATLWVEYRVFVNAKAPAEPRLAQFTAALPDDTPAGRARGWSALLALLADRVVADLPRT